MININRVHALINMKNPGRDKGDRSEIQYRKKLSERLAEKNRDGWLLGQGNTKRNTTYIFRRRHDEFQSISVGATRRFRTLSKSAGVRQLSERLVCL